MRRWDNNKKEKRHENMEMQQVVMYKVIFATQYIIEGLKPTWSNVRKNQNMQILGDSWNLLEKMRNNQMKTYKSLFKKY